MYAGELKIGAVYQSTMPDIHRRITGIKLYSTSDTQWIEYCYHQKNKMPCLCTTDEQMFREFTSHEITPEVLNQEHAATTSIEK